MFDENEFPHQCASRPYIAHLLDPRLVGVRAGMSEKFANLYIELTRAFNEE